MINKIKKFKYFISSINEVLIFWVFLIALSVFNGLNSDFICNLITDISAKFIFGYIFFNLLIDLFLIIKRRNF